MAESDALGRTVLRGLAWYPDGIPVRAFSSRLDAVERCRLTREEIETTLEWLERAGYVERAEGVARLAPAAASRVRRDEEGRPDFERTEWPPLGGAGDGDDA